MTTNPSLALDRDLCQNKSIIPTETCQKIEVGRFTLYSAQNALQSRPPQEWLVDQIIQPASLSVFFGDPGCKKTFSLIDLGVHVASGKEWLGRKVKQGNVLYIDEEMGEYDFFGRLGDNLRSNGCDGKTPIHSMFMEGLNISDGLDLIYLENMIRALNLSLVIIDAFVEVIPGLDENSSKDMNPVLMSLRRLAKDTGCAFIIAHHANKIGKFRGSTAISAAVDLLVQIKSPKAESMEITFKSEKFRYGKPFKFSADLEISESKFGLVQNSEQPGEGQRILGIAQRAIIDYLSKNGPSFTKDILANTNGATPNAIKQAINKMVENGYIHRVNEGGKGKKAMYDLTEKG